MLLEIFSPDKKIFSGEVEAVKFPGTAGSFGVLENHAPMISSLTKGQIKVTARGNVEYYEINGGFVEVMKNKITVLAD
jgi:F-type H+-transporting ATPase subunit epsilon